MEYFQYLMRWCVYFLSYPFQIWGFTFTLLQVGIFVFMAEICLNFIGRLLGKEELTTDD